MSILVTGGTGYIASYLLRALVERGEEVIAYDVAPETASIQDIAQKCVVIRGDVRNLVHVLHVMKEYRVNSVVHTAALLTTASQENPLSALQVNVEGSLNLFEAARLMDAERFVFTSSQAVFGETEARPIEEDYPKNPNTIYGVTKLTCEHFGINYANTYGLNFVALRFPVLYGPGRVRGMGTFATLVENPLRNQAARIERGGDQKYEPLYAKDAARSLMLALYAKNLQHRIFNIGTEEFVTLQDVSREVRKFVPNAQIDIRGGLDTAYASRGPMKIDRARQELGYEPEYDLEKGIEDYVRILRQTLWQ